MLTVSNQPPVVALIGPVVKSVECHAGTYTEEGATASDECDGVLDVVTGGDDVDSNSPGTYVVTYAATDADGNVTQVARTVNVVDTQPPLVTLNGDADIELACNDTYVEAGANAEDQCGGPVPVSIGGASVNTGTAGTYVVEYAATDASGNRGHATRTVRITDTVAPVITLLGDNPLLVECSTGGYTDPGVQIDDTCDSDLSPIIGGDSVNPLQPGTYVVTYDATDSSGNTAVQVSRTVVIEDTFAPVITLNGDNPLILECHGTPFVEPGAVAQDACEGLVSVQITGGDAVSVDAPAEFVISYDATDFDGNPAATVMRTVHVVDTTPPVFTYVPGDFSTTCSTGSILPQEFLDGATATDGCSTVTMTHNVAWLGECNQATALVTWTATDSSGNSNQASATVSVEPSTSLQQVQFDAIPEIRMGSTDEREFSVVVRNNSTCARANRVLRLVLEFRWGDGAVPGRPREPRRRVYR